MYIHTHIYICIYVQSFLNFVSMDLETSNPKTFRIVSSSGSYSVDGSQNVWLWVANATAEAAHAPHSHMLKSRLVQEIHVPEFAEGSFVGCRVHCVMTVLHVV